MRQPILLAVLAAVALAVPSSVLAEERFSLAGQIVRHSFGQIGDASRDTCLTCDFMSYFQLALADFSKASFSYFHSAWSLLAPIAMAIWLAWRAGSLMVMGGEDGRVFIISILKKLTLFALLWSMLSISTGGRSYQSWFWETAAVDYLSAAFGAATEMQSYALAAVPSNPLYSTSATGNDPFGCDGIAPSISTVNSAHQSAAQRYSFLAASMKLTCSTERVHILGVATALGVLTSSQSSDIGWNLGAAIVALALLVVKAMIALTILVLYLMSAVWLLFLVLDVVVRGLVIAMVSPLLALCALFQPTREIATRAIRQAAGAAVSAMAIAILGILSTLLMTNTVAVYNANFGSYVAQSDLEMTAIDLSGGPIPAFVEFVDRVGADDGPSIPIDFSTPWLYYILLSAVATLALGKKLISMMENLIGPQGASALADTAQQTTRQAVQVASGLMTAGSTVALASGGKFAGRGLGRAGSAALEKLSTKNPFGGGTAE